jgi:hypothetical protein
MVVVETHPEDVVDLRLDAPWPELQKLASTLNFEDMDSFEHGHVPYILILLKILEQWKEQVTFPISPSPSLQISLMYLAIPPSFSFNPTHASLQYYPPFPSTPVSDISMAHSQQ